MCCLMLVTRVPQEDHLQPITFSAALLCQLRHCSTDGGEDLCAGGVVGLIKIGAH